MGICTITSGEGLFEATVGFSFELSAVNPGPHIPDLGSNISDHLPAGALHEEGPNPPVAPVVLSTPEGGHNMGEQSGSTKDLKPLIPKYV